MNCSFFWYTKFKLVIIIFLVIYVSIRTWTFHKSHIKSNAANIMMKNYQKINCAIVGERAEQNRMFSHHKRTQWFLIKEQVQLGCSQGTNTFGSGGSNTTILLVLMLLLENTRRDTLILHHLVFTNGAIDMSLRYSAF